jgi:glycosyltransferase involved in cell wall biosynthesis
MFAFPNLNKSFNMYTTLVESFVQNGHEVTVIAPGDRTEIVKEANIEILRVASLPIKNVPNWVKGISNILLPMQFRRALKRIYPGRRYDLIVSATPPVTLSGLASTLKRRHNARFYLILRDIFPQNAVDLGFMRKGGWVWRYFRFREKQLYQAADYIGCMSQANISYLRENESWIPESKLHILRNFQKPIVATHALHLPETIDKIIRNKFVVVFGGNLGKPQQLENVLALAQYVQKYPDVLLLILGEGVQAERLHSDVAKLDITNVQIFGTMPKQDYQLLLKHCHIGLISLNIRFTIPNIPSKALDYWNVGLPILASIDRCTDFGNLLDETNTGLWAYADNPIALQKQFDMLFSDSILRVDMAEAGRAYFTENLTPELAYQTVVSHVEA